MMPFKRTLCKYTEMFENGPKLNSIATFCINKCISANYSQVVSEYVSTGAVSLLALPLNLVVTIMLHYRYPQACSRAGLFQRFVSRNMDKLVLDHNVDDVIQMALLLPETSNIYKQAMEIVKAENLFFLDW